MSKDIIPQSTPDLAAARKKLAPHIHHAFTPSARVSWPKVHCRDQAAEQVVSSPVAQSTSIGDPDTHRQYSSLFKRLRGRRLQVERSDSWVARRAAERRGSLEYGRPEARSMNTKVAINGLGHDLVKIMSRYDNEWGYLNQMVHEPVSITARSSRDET